MTGEFVIRVGELSRTFGSVTALDGLNFQVRSGELFGIVGPDGAGKTTLLRILAGVLPPSAGDAEIMGVSVAQNPEGVKPHQAYMAQRFGLYEDLTVQENLDFYADLFLVPREARSARMERLYEFSRLGEFRDRLAGNLSGGMKQKLGLSCALVHEPAILLLDEPTFGVDPISRRDLWLILHEMVARGVTVVVSTAYMDEAERCDRVALLHDGRLLALDSPERLQRELPGVLISVTSSDPRGARDAVAGLPGAAPTLFGETLHVLLPDEDALDPVLSAIGDAGIQVREYGPVPPTLEDVFIQRVRQEEGA